MITTWSGVALATLGALWCLLAAVGLLRLGDPLSRLQAVTKASTLGLLLTLAGATLADSSWAFAAKATLVVLFLFLVTPVAGHLIGRATYRAGLAGRLRIDELARPRSQEGPAGDATGASPRA